jgi:hypothetical protein
MSPEDFGKICRGMGAVSDALCEIGGSERTDHDLAKHIVDASEDVRAMLQFVVTKLAEGVMP